MHQSPKCVRDSVGVSTGARLAAPFGGSVLPTSSMSGCAQQFGADRLDAKCGTIVWMLYLRR